MKTETEVNDFIMNLMDTTPLIIWLTDEHNHIRFVNGNTEKLLECAKHDLLGTNVSRWIDRISLEKVNALLVTTKEADTIETELNLYSKNGNENSYYTYVKVLPDQRTLYIFAPVSTEYFQITEQLLEINSDFSNLYSELYEKNEIIERQKQDYYMLSVTDALTTLYNRRYFYEIAEEEVEHTINRHSPLSFLLIDVNDFKKVNDRYGHHAGDRLLIKIADTLQRNSGEEEKAFRLGGDEFLVMLHRTKEESVRWAEDVSQEVATFSEIATLSYGVEEFSEEKDITALLNNADSAMYQFKRRVKEGRGRV